MERNMTNPGVIRIAWDDDSRPLYIPLAYLISGDSRAWPGWDQMPESEWRRLLYFEDKEYGGRDWQSRVGSHHYATVMELQQRAEDAKGSGTRIGGLGWE